jgi:hydroxyethylthiazole kinase-like sugar kinase family protein
MLNEAVKHIREAIMLGRTDIIKKLLEEVKMSLIKGNFFVIFLRFR